MDLSNLGQQFTSGGLLDRISHFVGGTPEATKETLNAALPTTMYSIADHGSTEIGAASLLEGLKSGQAPQLDVAGLSNALSNPQASEGLVKSSGGFLEKMLGGRLGGLVGALSSFGGGDRGMTSKLLALVAPLALGVIGKRVREGGLDAGGLAGFLGDQKSKVASLVPGPLRAAVGLPTMPERPREIRGEASFAPHVRPLAKPMRPARTHWGLVLVAFAALFALGWLMARAFRGTRTPSVTAPTLPVPSLPKPAVPHLTPTPPEVSAAAAANAARGPIADYLASGQTAPKRFTLEGIYFATNESILNGESQRTVSDVAVALKAHPKASLRIEGFVDATGDAVANQELGQARADAVKAALVADGVSIDRLSTTIVGQERPTASNADGAGRAETRRAEVVVTPR